MFLGGCPCCKKCWKCYGKVVSGPDLPDVGCGKYKLPASIHLKTFLTVGEVVVTPEFVDYKYSVAAVQAWVNSIDFKVFLQEDPNSGDLTYRARGGIDAICRPITPIAPDTSLDLKTEMAARTSIDWLPCDNPVNQGSKFLSCVNIDALGCAKLMVRKGTGPTSEPDSGLRFCGCNNLENDEWISLSRLLPSVGEDFNLGDTPDKQTFQVVYDNRHYISVWGCDGLGQQQDERRAITGYIQIEFQYETEDSTGRCCFSEDGGNECLTITKKECEEKKGLWSAGITCEDVPCVIEEHQCFNSNPNPELGEEEQVWLPLGNCHATEEECAEECGWRCYGELQDECCKTDTQGAGYQYAELIASDAIQPNDFSGLTLITDGKFQFVRGQTRTETPFAGCKTAMAEFVVGDPDVNIPAKAIGVYTNWLDRSPENQRGPLVYLRFNLGGGIGNPFSSYATWIKKATFAGKTIIGGEGCAGVFFFPDAKCDLPELRTYPPSDIGNDPQLYEIQETVPTESFTGLVEVEWLYQQRERDPNIPDSDYVIIFEDSGAFSFEWDQVVEMAACLPCGEDPDTPVEYQCFDAPPDEEGWTPFGEGHPDEESCAEECPPTTTPPGGLTMPTTKTIGPGTHLKNMLATWGIHAKKGGGCKCKDMEVKMNRWGSDCRQHMDAIVDHLQAEAKKRNLPFVRRAGEMLVKRAIKRFEK